MLLPTTDNGVRPAGEPDRCFYCRAGISEPHGPECVMVRRSVVIRATIDFVHDVPAHWGEDDIRFNLNESSRCAGNTLADLAEQAEGEWCFCGQIDHDFVREATEEDHQDLGFEQPRPKHDLDVAADLLEERGMHGAATVLRMSRVGSLRSESED